MSSTQDLACRPAGCTQLALHTCLGMLISHNAHAVKLKAVASQSTSDPQPHRQTCYNLGAQSIGNCHALAAVENV